MKLAYERKVGVFFLTRKKNLQSLKRENIHDAELKKNEVCVIFYDFILDI